MNYLEDVPDDKVFYLGDKSIRNLYGLLYELRGISDEEYSHYASTEHNYFSDWIQSVIGYHDLSSELRKTNSRETAISILEKSIEHLKKEKEQHRLEQSELPKQEESLISGPKEDTKQIAQQSEPQKAKPMQEEPKKEEKHMAKIVVSENEKHKYGTEENSLSNAEIEKFMSRIGSNKKEMKVFLWKHFLWDMALEFMYGMALGLLMGLVMSRIFFRF